MKFVLHIVAVALLSALCLSLVNAQESEPPANSLSGLPTREPQPAPTLRTTVEDAVFDVYFEYIPQGDLGLMRVLSRDPNLPGRRVVGAQARFSQRILDFYPGPDGAFYGVLAAGMEQPVRRYDLDVVVTYEDGTTTNIERTVEVTGGPFIREEFSVPSDKAYLVNPDIERNELARLESIFDQVTLEKRWTDEGFQMPILSTLTSPFGAFRTFNQTLNTRHTGWDIRTTLGMPIMASGDGVVAYAGMMEIRGNYVIVDHGYGIYSGYAHMSQVHVTRGQSVTKGQVLGMTGDTGRTSGPHFHWEMAVNGEWIDTVQFITMWLP